MTTAAPPEKMSEYDEAMAAFLRAYPDMNSAVSIGYNMPIVARLLKAILDVEEAARRLAPRVGDGGLRERIANLVCSEGQLDTPTEPDCANRAEHLELADAIIALSAPPAASADLTKPK